VAQRVLLHVGLPKSGTTFLQSVLAANKDRLAAEHGLLFPGRDWKDQVRAARDVREMRGHNARTRAMSRGAWKRLAREINAWPTDAVISMEWLCQAKPHQIQRIVDDVAPARVEVVLTVRDLGRRIPASWQESVLNENMWSWREFLDEITAEDPPGVAPEDAPPRRFWKMHDTAAHLRRWTTVLPTDHAHVVTVPPGDAPRSALWDRFCEVLGVEADGLSTAVERSNESLDLAATEMVRRLNLRFREAGVSRKGIVAQQLAKAGLSRRESLQPRATLPAELHGWLQHRADAEIAGIRAAGAHVVGDLDDLVPDLSRHVGGRQPEELADADLLDAALDALVISVQGHADSMRDHARALERTEKKLDRLVEREERLRSQLEQWRAHPLRSAARSRWRRATQDPSRTPS
jgi:hypothetical protein